MIRKNIIKQAKELKSKILAVKYSFNPRTFNYKTLTFSEYEKELEIVNKEFFLFYNENKDYINNDDKILENFNKIEHLLLQATSYKYIKNPENYFDDGGVIASGVSYVEPC